MGYTRIDIIMSMILIALWRLGTVHKHLLGRPDVKRGALKMFDPCKGSLEKNIP